MTQHILLSAYLYYGRSVKWFMVCYHTFRYSACSQLLSLCPEPESGSRIRLFPHKHDSSGFNTQIPATSSVQYLTISFI